MSDLAKRLDVPLLEVHAKPGEWRKAIEKELRQSGRVTRDLTAHAAAHYCHHLSCQYPASDDPPALDEDPALMLRRASRRAPSSQRGRALIT